MSPPCSEHLPKLNPFKKQDTAIDFMTGLFTHQDSMSRSRFDETEYEVLSK